MAKVSKRFGGYKIKSDKFLSKIVGDKALSLTNFTKKLWEYINAKKLKKKGYVLPNKTLAKIVGEKRLKITSLSKKIWKYVKENNLLISPKSKELSYTLIDDFYDLIMRKGEVGLIEASILLGRPTYEVEHWALALEKAKLLKIIYTPFGVKLKKVKK